jgi:predicted ATPase
LLKKLILENWKSFRYAELPLDPLTVLIGTNASGKSNVVEALEFLQRTFIRKDIRPALVGDSTLSSIRGGLEGAALKPNKEFTLKIIAGGNKINTDIMYTITVKTKPSLGVVEELINQHDLQDELCQTNNQILNFFKTKFINKNEIHEEYKSSKYRIGGSFFPTQTHLTDLIRVYSNLDIDSELCEDFFYSLNNIFVINPLPDRMRNYSQLSEYIESDGSNIAGVLAALTDDKKAEIENTLSKYLKDLPEGDIKKVWAEKVGRFGYDAMLYCQEEWKPGEITEIDARSMSDGTLRFLAILTALLTRPEGSQIVIEEIDNGLHPSRAALLVKILKEIGTKRNIDILLTTHNPALLDAFGSEIVPFVVVAHRDSETGESKLTLLEDIDNFPKLFASYSLGQMTTKGAIERSLSHGE